jgi:hypothetical protein
MNWLLIALGHRVRDWPKAMREFYARYWYMLVIPRIALTPPLAVLLFAIMIPLALIRGIPDHIDRIRRGA